MENGFYEMRYGIFISVAVAPVGNSKMVMFIRFRTTSSTLSSLSAAGATILQLNHVNQMHAISELILYFNSERLVNATISIRTELET